MELFPLLRSLLTTTTTEPNKWLGPLETTLSKFETYLSQPMPFFDDYTDHGPAHISTVLRSALALIPQNTLTNRASEVAGWRVGTEGTLTPADVAVLVLAVVLHDCAMHLTVDGLACILSTARWSPPTSRFIPEEPPWPELYNSYWREASRYDEQKLQLLFGASTSVHPPAPNARLNEVELKWVGEFLRQNHGRLAHEIALAGFPGPGNQRVALPSEFDSWMTDLAGLIARSHSLDFRAAVDLLPAHSSKDFRGVHAPFLMALIRMADYLDIDRQRVSLDTLKFRSLRSPVSSREWKKHEATVYIKVEDNDPETLFIDADPQDLETFVALRSLYSSLQFELDSCWAVLGEVYRADPSFGLRIRRIRSTLDHPELLRTSFVPMVAHLRSNPRLLKYMVRPFYDDQASYGIRELVQNAVDACLELEHLAAHAQLVGSPSELEADVVVTVEESEHQGDRAGWIIVEDRGIGMTPEVVRDYFLTAGASYRESDSWRATLDESGKGRVVRSGRFGVGVMAGFLLGDSIEVCTRHATQPEDRGVEFKAAISAPLIAMSWRSRGYGTTIRIEVTRPEVFDQLANPKSWDWYRFAKPSLRRKLVIRRDDRPCHRAFAGGNQCQLGKMQELQPAEILPNGSVPVPPHWRTLRATGFEEVLWTFEGPRRNEDACNGFVLESPDRSFTGLHKLWSSRPQDIPIYLFRPRVSVVDRDALLDIDLKRTRILSMTFSSELTEMVCREILAKLLLQTGTTRAQVLLQIHEGSISHPGVSSSPDEHRTKAPGLPRSSWLGLAADGLTPACMAGASSSVTAHSLDDFTHRNSRTLGSPRAQVERAVDLVRPGVFITPVWTDAESFFRSVTNGGPAALLLPQSNAAQLSPDIRTRDLGNGWLLAAGGEHFDLPVDVQHLPLARPDDPPVLFSPVHQPAATPEDNPLVKLWLQLFRQHTIPLDLYQRKRELQDAYKELAVEISRFDLRQELTVTA